MYRPHPVSTRPPYGVHPVNKIDSAVIAAACWLVLAVAMAWAAVDALMDLWQGVA